jgi:hypothetical protein
MTINIPITTDSLMIVGLLVFAAILILREFQVRKMEAEVFKQKQELLQMAMFLAATRPTTANKNEKEREEETRLVQLVTNPILNGGKYEI